ncbi:hypothetical protein KBX53_33110 [Micromonospora sp. M51]|uniref:hypothetical protein n=1 Tax=Micromonospora sp. M51 TaxID=2824889 RepID=UPI001B395DB8|nr:hypothetical protein [Micromonospora sp. M51]MBQ1015681.1 hypothetical protein [Micromonospora sp. M51]
MRVRGRLTWGRRARALAVLTVLLAGVLPPAVALVPGTASAGAAAGTPVCEVRDNRLREISGMVATDDGYVVINDGADDEARRRIFFLDQRCAVRRTVSFPSRPRDTGSPTSATTTGPGRRSGCGDSRRGRSNRCCTG